MSTKIAIWLSDSQAAGELDVTDAHALVDYDLAVFDEDYNICLHHQYSVLSDAYADLLLYRDNIPRRI